MSGGGFSHMPRSMASNSRSTMSLSAQGLLCWKNCWVSGSNT